MTGDSTPSLEPVTVLVADDHAGFRALLAVLAEDAGDAVEAVEASSGAEAIRLALRLGPQIAVLDLNMPQLTGLQAALTLRDERPAMRIALASTDPRTLHERAAGLGLPLFDKSDAAVLSRWVRAQVSAVRGQQSRRVRAAA
jgi:CheY-like chemotaxis protein